MSVESLFSERLALLKSLESSLTEIATVSDALLNCLRNGGKILIAGNGGSAATASHFAAEIVGRFKKERRGYPALALGSDTVILSALANDYGYSAALSKEIEALGTEKDVFVALSTSGESENLVKALETARRKHLYTISFLGRDGGKQKKLADIDIVIPSTDTAQIQEMHLIYLHLIAEIMENDLKANE